MIVKYSWYILSISNLLIFFCYLTFFFCQLPLLENVNNGGQGIDIKAVVLHAYVFSKLFTISTSSVQFSCSVMSDSLWPHGLQHARLPGLLLTPGAYSNSCPSSWWCHPTISSSVVSFSSCLQFFPASGTFPVSQFFASGGQSIGVSALASVLPMTGQISLPEILLSSYP